MNQVQITNEEFRRTKELLYRYFEQPKQVENIRHHIVLLKQQVNELETRIYITDVHFM